ncbi:MAG: hypothetical protein HFG05_13255 [Oscillibacter sp.]|nr:hypothetical protein [Oscillibacter sp.]
MTEIERMRRYIERTHMSKSDNYCLVYSEAVELARSAGPDSIFDAIALAFDYGKAKGYRAAKAKRRATA